MRLLTCAFASPTEFLACYSAASPEGALFCRTRSRLQPEEDLLVETWFPGLANHTLVRGAVADVEPGRGAWIRWHAGDAHSRDFLLALARGELGAGDQVARGHRRIPAALPVACHIEELDQPARERRRFKGHTHDVGGGGAFVHTPDLPQVGTRISVRLGPVASQPAPFRLEGRVAWIRRDPRAHGFGVKFDPKAGTDAGRLRAMVRRAWESGWVEFAG